MEHITQAKRRLKALLLDKLPAKLTDLEPEIGRVEPPHEIHTTNKVGDLGGYPAIELGGTGSSGDGRTSAQIYRHRIICSVTVAGDDEEQLTLDAEAYIYAIRQIARDTQLEELGCGPVDTGEEEYTPVSRRQNVETPFVKGGFIELFVKTLE